MAQEQRREDRREIEKDKKRAPMCQEKERDNVLPKISMFQVISKFLKWEGLQIIKIRGSM